MVLFELIFQIKKNNDMIKSIERTLMSMGDDGGPSDDWNAYSWYDPFEGYGSWGRGGACE